MHTRHERLFEHYRFVYPVLSRRSNGISVGVNLNPDKICNFDCIYCQVDRSTQSEIQFVQTDRLGVELDEILEWITSGRIYETGKFQITPASLRRLNDIAFSGDGEPTTYRDFDQIIRRCADVKRRRALDEVKMVLITNASMFHRPPVRCGLEILDANQGEIWAKLEAGSEEYYQRVARTPVPFRQILDNIAAAAQARPLVIQSLFMRIDERPPSSAELDAFCDRLCEITAAGGQLSHVQIYTLARPPTQSTVTPLSDDELRAIVDRVRHRTGLDATGYTSSTS